MKLFLFLIAMTAACGCSSSVGTAYYYGQVDFYSSDGKTPFGKTASLIKRDIRPSDNQIIEAVIQPPRHPDEKPKEHIVTMTRVLGTNEFFGTDPERSFEGRQIFEGQGWSLPRWVYDIRLKDGGKLVGKGSLDTEGIKTTKTFFNPQGVPTVLMEEDLRAITMDEYAKRRQEMLTQ